MYRLVVLTIVLAYNVPFTWATPYIQHPGAPLPAFPHLQAAPLRAFPLPAAPVALPTRLVNEYATKSAPIAAPVSYDPIEAAVLTRRTVELRNVASVQQEAPVQQEFVVPPNYETVVLHFKTASSPLSVRQTHIAAPETPVEHSSVEDNPQRLVQEVNKPVIQEVREVIQPFRRITQEIRPVVEEIHTILHKGERAAYGPLPLKMAAPAYGPGAAIVANSAAFKNKAA